MAQAARQTLTLLLDDLQQALLALFSERAQAPSRARLALQRRLLLGLELLWKLEEQVVLPALHEAEPGWAGAITPATRELELMRDLAMLAVQTAAANREVSFAVLEGLASLHFARVGELLAQPGAQAADWPLLEREVRTLLNRWHRELREEGEIEDEDRDPVGLAPR